MKTDQPKPTTGEWTTCPVLHGDGSEWQELRYLVDPIGRKHGSMNEQVAIGLVKAINAALDAERELADIGRKWRKDSSLKTWFPFTAEEQKELIDCVDQTWDVLEPDSGTKAWPWGLLAAARQLRSQLAAAQAAKEQAVLTERAKYESFVPLDDQIAAAHQPLVDALEDVLNDLEGIRCEKLATAGQFSEATAISSARVKIDAALARVKEGK